MALVVVAVAVPVTAVAAVATWVVRGPHPEAGGSGAGAVTPVAGAVPTGAATGAGTTMATATGSATGSPTGTATSGAAASGVFALPLRGDAQQIGPQFFGMTSLNDLDPPIPFGAERFWDTGTTWAALEPARGRYTWTRLDTLVDAARARHAEVLLTLAGTPTWASSEPTEQTPYGLGSTSAPRDIADWRAFVRAVAQRYRGRIAGYEIWNEPESSTFFWRGTPQQLAELTTVAGEEIHRADPGADVLMGGFNLASTASTTRIANAFFAAGGGRRLTGVCVHMYPDGGTSLAANAQWLRSFRAVLARWHADTLPQWLCETGYGRAAKKVFYEGSQARTLVARSHLEAAYLGLSRHYWYAYDTRGFVGLYLVGADGHTPTSAATAYARTYRWMVGARFLGCAVDKRGSGTQVWACKLQRGSGSAWALWRVGKAASVTVPPGVTRSQNLLGTTRTVTAGSTLAVGAEPVLLTSGGWTS